MTGSEKDGKKKMKFERTGDWKRFLKGFCVMIGILLAATVVCFLFQQLGFSEENMIIVYILGVLIIAIITVNRGWSVLSSLLSVLLFNFCLQSRYLHFRLMGPDIR